MTCATGVVEWQLAAGLDMPFLVSGTKQESTNFGSKILGHRKTAGEGENVGREERGGEPCIQIGWD